MPTHHRLLLSMGALHMALAVMAGAFGAHALQHILSPERLAVWQTAVLYQLIHALGVLIIVGLSLILKQSSLLKCAWLIQLGILLFCGSLYLLCLSTLTLLGPITPIGGLCFIVSWIWAGITLYRSNMTH